MLEGMGERCQRLDLCQSILRTLSYDELRMNGSGMVYGLEIHQRNLSENWVEIGLN